MSPDETIALLLKASADLRFYATLTETHVGKPHDAYATETADKVDAYLARINSKGGG